MLTERCVPSGESVSSQFPFQQTNSPASPTAHVFRERALTERYVPSGESTLSLYNPQQTILPDARSAQLWEEPALTETTGSEAETTVGDGVALGGVAVGVVAGAVGDT